MEVDFSHKSQALHPHGSGRCRQHWVVERTLPACTTAAVSWIRTDRRDDIHEGFLALACCLICWRRLESFSLAANRVGAGL